MDAVGRCAQTLTTTLTCKEVSIMAAPHCTRLAAAIYVRKSSDEGDRESEAKSVTRQREHGLEFATTRGWHSDPALIFEDDGISGAEFAKRPGLLRMLNAVKQFDVL